VFHKKANYQTKHACCLTVCGIH